MRTLTEEEYLVAVMEKVAGEVQAPAHLRDGARRALVLGYMRYADWPAGHWQITDKGRALIAAEAKKGRR